MESLEKALEFELEGVEDISDCFYDDKKQSVKPRVETRFKIASPHPRGRRSLEENPAPLRPLISPSRSDPSLPGSVSRITGEGREPSGVDGLFALNPRELRLKRSKRLAVARYYVEVNRCQTSSTQLSTVDETGLRRPNSAREEGRRERVVFDSNVAVFHQEFKLPEPDSCLGVRTALRVLRVLPPKPPPSSETFKSWSELDGSHKRLRMIRFASPSPSSLLDLPTMRGSVSPSLPKRAVHSFYC